MYIQLLFTVFVVVVLINLFKRWQARLISQSRLIIWLMLWLVALVVFWLPDSTNYIANILGIGRGVDLVIYVSIVVIFYLLFRLYLAIDKLSGQITKIVRHLAASKQVKDKHHDT